MKIKSMTYLVVHINPEEEKLYNFTLLSYNFTLFYTLALLESVDFTLLLN